MEVVAAINLKGGVGKTSLCLHLAGALSQMGRRVLAVDNDPQSSLTAGFLGMTPARDIDRAATIAAIYSGDDPMPGRVIRPAGVGAIHLLPGSRYAAEANVPGPHRVPRAEQRRLADFLDLVRDDYDVALVDCPPNLHLCSWAAMAAADAYVVPVQPEDFGAQGIRDVTESAEAVRRVVNPRLALAGYVITMHQARLNLHREYIAHLREQHGGLVFAATMPRASDYAEAVMARTPVGMHRPGGAASKAIRAIADELTARLAAGAAAGEAA